jgi:cyclophilin family peptidyl-prolyl cis-trans isomerase
MATPAHKAATSVTLAPLQEKSALETFVQQYWKHALALVLAITLGILFAHQRSQAARAERAVGWDTIATRASVDPFTRTLQADPETWAALAQELKDKGAGPWARLMQAKRLVDDRKYDEAAAALAQLRADYPAHPLVTDSWRASDQDSGLSLVALIEKRLQDRASWESARPNLFANPPPEEGAPKLAIKTSKGEVVVALYPAKAPQHVAKFLELVDAKHFDGMAVHEVAAGQSFSAGDPNTKGDDTATWGLGGRDLVLPFETSGLHHFAGALSAEAGATAKESLGGLFSIFAADSLLDDDTRVVFGVVESGLDVVRQIAAAETDPTAPTRPKEAIRILSVARQ